MDVAPSVEKHVRRTGKSFTWFAGISGFVVSAYAPRPRDDVALFFPMLNERQFTTAFIDVIPGRLICDQ
jgi:hypothetical protein